MLIHNPRCSKSREAKDILTEKGIEFEIIDYLKDGLKEKLILKLPELTGLSYPDLVRTKEDIYKELKLKEKKLSKDEWVDLLQQHPILLERPIFIHNFKAIVARPPEKVLEIL